MMEFSFSEQVVATRKGPRVAMVVRPRGHYVLGRAWFDKLRAHAGSRSRANPFIDEVARRGGRVRVFVFCGRTEDGAGSYQLDDNFSPAELLVHAQAILHAQLPIYREFLRAGVSANVHVGWSARQCDAFREALVLLADRYERREHTPSVPAIERQRARVDRWIARNLLVFLTLGVERALSELLPDTLTLLETRAARIAEMLAAIPRSR